MGLLLANTRNAELNGNHPTLVVQQPRLWFACALCADLERVCGAAGQRVCCRHLHSQATPAASPGPGQAAPSTKHQPGRRCSGVSSCNMTCTTQGQAHRGSRTAQPMKKRQQPACQVGQPSLHACVARPQVESFGQAAAGILEDAVNLCGLQLSQSDAAPYLQPQRSVSPHSPGSGSAVYACRQPVFAPHMLRVRFLCLAGG